MTQIPRKRRRTWKPGLAAGIAHLALFALWLGRTPAASAGDWEVRYAQQPDQRPEWTEMGRTPDWKIDWQDKTRPEVAWTDNDAGDCRGWLVFCKPVRLPAGAKGTLSLQFQYRTHCDLDAPPMVRSGVLYAVVMKRDAWEGLATEPDQAPPLDIARRPGVLAASVKRHGEDVHDWADSGPVDFPVVPADWVAADGTVLVGIAWGAYHYGCNEYGAFRNLEVEMKTKEEAEWEFWNALDPEHPGLEKVAAAVAERDRDAAAAALAEYVRNRKGPKVGNPVEPATAGVMRRADETLAHTYRLAGCKPYTFDGDIVWNFDPYNYDQWPIHLNRHTEWRFLAAAYLATGQDRYAAEWADQVVKWVAAMPVFIGPHWIQGPYNAPGRSPLSLDAGIRLGQHWFPAFKVLRRSPAVPDAALVAFVQSCYRHALYLMRDSNFKTGSNWGAMESNGLFHIGVMFPEFRDARTWRDTALQRTTGEIDLQVYPDGAQTELAPGYHGVSLGNFLGVMKLARANDLALPDDFVGRLERMFGYYLKICTPDLRLPPLNDSGRGSFSWVFRDGVDLFPERDDFRWVLSARRQGRPPKFTDIVMPYAGWVVTRSDWGPDARYLLFDAGPFGTGHQHEDRLGIILFAFGRELISEAGVYAYDRSQWRRYVLSTRAHSTVRIDGKDQNSRHDRSQYRATEPHTYGFFDSDAYCYARDTHRAGYGTPPDRSIRHRRRILFVKPDFWILVDDYAGEGGAVHDIESQFLINLPDAGIDEPSLRVTALPEHDDAAGILIVPLTPAGLSVRIAKGETEPEVRGFMPRGFENLVPTPAALYSRRFSEQALDAYALVPFRGAAPPRVAVEPLETADGARIRLRVGDGERILRITATELACETAETPFLASEDPL
jgi:hypothetical protein